MGLIKSLGKVAGCVAGVVVGGTVELVGEVVKSDFLKEVGDGVYKASERTGEMLGGIAEGGAEALYGAINSDKNMQAQGIDKIIEMGGAYVSSAAKGIANVANKGVETVGAILDGDTDTAKRTGKEVAKVALVSTLTVGVLDVIDGLDGLDPDVGMLDTAEAIENPNMHHVSPHFRTLPDGREIWVDGDGDTTVDTYEGWYQHNPDYKG